MSDQWDPINFKTGFYGYSNNNTTDPPIVPPPITNGCNIWCELAEWIKDPKGIGAMEEFIKIIFEAIKEFIIWDFECTKNTVVYLYNLIKYYIFKNTMPPTDQPTFIC